MLVKDLMRRRGWLRKRIWTALVEKSNLERAAAIHVTSAVESEQLRAFGFELPRVAEVPNGVDEPVAADHPVSEAARRVFDAGQPFVLYLGRISWKKGLDRLIEALAGVPGARAVIAGNDEEGYSSHLLALARQHGVKDRVDFIGPAYGRVKQELFRSAPPCSRCPRTRRTLATSFSRPWPPDARSWSRPRWAQPPSWPRPAPAWSPQASRLRWPRRCAPSDDPERAAQMGSRGAAWVAEKYSWDVVAARMLDLYRSLPAARKEAAAGCHAEKSSHCCSGFRAAW